MIIVTQDLEKAVQSVVSSLEEADEVVKAAIATVVSKEGLTDSDKMDLTEKLEAKAQNIEESIRSKCEHYCIAPLQSATKH